MQAYRENIWRILTWLFIVSFFLPYFHGTPLRVDQILGWGYILFTLERIIRQKKIVAPTRLVALLLLSAFCILAFTSIRIFSIPPDNMRAALQITNQFSYLAAGCAIAFIHRKHGIEKSAINGLYAVSLLVNLLAIVQYFSPHSNFVALCLRLYGGTGDASYVYEDFNTISALTLLGGGQSVSLFNGVQGLAIFDLFIVAMTTGSLLASNRDSKAVIWVALISLFFSFTGGALSGSKTFFFGFWVYIVIFIGVALQQGKMGKKHFVSFILFLITFLTIYAIFSEKLRVTGDVLKLFTSGRIDLLFQSRFGNGSTPGYLSDVMAKTFEPLTLAIGLGANAVDYKYTDFQFRQIILVGGIPLFTLYYGFLIMLARLNWLARHNSSYALPLFALAIAYIATGVGMDTHLQARTITLWVAFNILLCIGDKNASKTDRLASRSYSPADSQQV